jgi:hypothetical protein
MLSHYRDLGVPLDDRHLEVVIRQMVRVEDGTVRGVTEVASQGGDFLTAAAAFGGAAALADAAARGRTMPLNGVASSTAMGKLMPARVPATAL